MKVLQIIESAYRATLDEQDDTVVWLTHVLAGAGAQVDVLLRGNAVNYAVPAQQAEGFAVGAWRQTQPPRLAHDIESLAAKGVRVFALAEDLAAHGLRGAALVGGVQPLGTADLAAALSGYDRAWHW